MLQLAVGKTTLLRPRIPVTRILLGNPENALAARPTFNGGDDGKQGTAPPAPNRPGVAEVDVVLLSPSEIYLLGKTVGSTNLMLLDRTGGCTLVDVAVAMDTVTLGASLKELLPAETGIKLAAAADSLVLSGTVSDAAAADQVMDIASAYVRRVSAGGGGGTRTTPHDRIINMLVVAAPQQVMLEVKVAEISKSLLDQFGIDFSRAVANADDGTIRFLSGLFGGAPLLAGQIGGTGPKGASLSSVDAVLGGSINGIPGVSGGNVTVTYDAQNRPTYTTSYGTVPSRNVTNVQLNMQKTDGLVKILAEPNVMAISGQEGSFLAGGKIFIPVSSPNGTGGAQITLEEREFGVSVRFTPTVLSGNRINLKVSPEVSELNAQGIAITASTLSGAQILPSFTTRRASTTVQLMDGQSFAIGGLIKNNVTSNISAFPFLGELPVIGALFRSTSFQTDRSELVFVITPRLVKPLPPNYALPTDKYAPPTRSEMILGGKLEGARPDGAPAAPPATVPADERLEIK